MPRLLVVDDDRASAEVMAEVLRRAGFDCAVALSGRSAIDLAIREPPDLMLLDYDMPDLDAVEVLDQLRVSEGQRPVFPVLILTGARIGTADQVLGLEHGAVDYVIKGTDRRVLVARIHAALRRNTPGPIVGAGGRLLLDLRTRAVALDGTALRMQPRHFDVLAALVRRDGQVATRAELLKEVWSSDYRGFDHAVDQAVHALRHSLPDPTWIETVRGVGYRLRPAP